MNEESSFSPQPLKISLPSGVFLETDFWKPTRTGGTPAVGNKVAICLHPWSWLGGRKEDPVLSSLIEPLLSRNYHIFSYNSRGVGGSTGWASFTGFSEGEDLKALVKWVIDDVSDVHSIVILGYSHGSLISSLHPILPSVKISHILISYPLGPRSWLTLFNSSAYTTALRQLVRSDSNVLLVFGDQDEFTSITKYRAWTFDLQGENVEIAEVKNASHFWRGRSGLELAEIIKRWLP